MTIKTICTAFALITALTLTGCGDNTPAQPLDTYGPSTPAPLANPTGCWKVVSPIGAQPEEIDLFLGGSLRAFTNGAEVDGVWRMDFAASQLDLSVEVSTGEPPTVQTTTQIYQVEQLTTQTLLITNRETDAVYGRVVCR